MCVGKEIHEQLPVLIVSQEYEQVDDETVQRRLYIMVTSRDGQLFNYPAYFTDNNQLVCFSLAGDYLHYS